MSFAGEMPPTLRGEVVSAAAIQLKSVAEMNFYMLSTAKQSRA
jgi:hypothetical protein